MNRKFAIKTVFIAIALILLLAIVYSGLRILESTVFIHQGEETGRQTKWIVRDGTRYFPRQDLKVILLMGIDKDDVVAGDETDKGHAADMIALLIFDEEAEESRVLLLNRDTMVMMDGLNDQGQKDGRYHRQLALSHADGSGREDSCENVRDTVSELLYGITIDHYLSSNMGGIAVLNDGVGGVTVQVTDDFSSIDPSIGMGEVTLHGQQAMNFVRTRKGLGDQLNLSRIERHKTYMNGFLDALREKLKEGSGAALSLFEMVSPYLVTDCSGTVLTDMMDRYADYDLAEIVTIEGENVRGNQFMEFHLDEESLDEVVLRLFYAPKK